MGFSIAESGIPFRPTHMVPFRPTQNNPRNQTFFSNCSILLIRRTAAHIINLWRYDEQTDGMRVVRSFAFQDEGVYIQVSVLNGDWVPKRR